MTDLGGTFWPTDINNRSQIVGTRDDAPGGWVWSKMADLPEQVISAPRSRSTMARRRPGTADRLRTVPTGPRYGLMAELELSRWTMSRTSTIERQVAGGQLVAEGFHAKVFGSPGGL